MDRILSRSTQVVRVLLDRILTRGTQVVNIERGQSSGDCPWSQSPECRLSAEADPGTRDGGDLPYQCDLAYNLLRSTGHRSGSFN